MRKIYIPFFAFLFFIGSCRNFGGKPVHGNGNITTETRNVSETDRISAAGSYNIRLIQGPSFSVKVEADENLMPYIITENRDGELKIHTKDKYSINTDHDINITITLDKLSKLSIAGSSNVNGEGKFTSSNGLDLAIAGSGNIDINVNAPDVESTIAGTGDISLTGETKNSEIHIAGVGNYDAQNLMSENVKVHIAGSGNAKVFAENLLDIDIAGSGDVYYKGKASVSQKIGGSGKIVKMD